MHIYIHIHTRMYTYMNIRIHKYLYLQMNLHAFIHVYMHILQGNNVTDVDEVEVLQTLAHLTALTLEGNPVAMQGSCSHVTMLMPSVSRA